MAGKRKQQPLTLGIDQVTIRVYPFGGDKPIPGWIQDGMLDTVAGGPSRRTRVEIDSPDRCGCAGIDFNYARECIRKQGYTKAVIILSDGEKMAI